jgi:hypothetical protein
MEDLDEAMDHFLDVFRCMFNPRVGWGDIRDEEMIVFLEGMSYLAQHLGPEVASGFHSLVRTACAEIGSLKLVNDHLDSEDSKEQLERERSALVLGLLLHKHVMGFQQYLALHMAKCVAGEEEADTKLTDHSRNDI